MFREVDESNSREREVQPGWRSALGLKLAMLGVLLLAIQANIGAYRSAETDQGSVPTALIVLSKGI